MKSYPLPSIVHTCDSAVDLGNRIEGMSCQGRKTAEGQGSDAVGQRLARAAVSVSTVVHNIIILLLQCTEQHFFY